MYPHARVRGETEERADVYMNRFQWKKKYTIWAILGVTYLLVFLVLMLIVNQDILGKTIKAGLGVLAPVTMGLIIAYLANPLYNFIHDNLLTWENKAQGLRKTLTMLLTYIVILLFLAALLTLIIPQLIGSISDLVNNISTYIDTALKYINGFLSKLTFLETPPQISSDDIEAYFQKYLGGDDNSSLLDRVIGLFKEYGSDISGYVASILSSVVGFVVDLAVALFIAGYTLASKQRLGAQCRKVFTAIFREKGCKNICHFFSVANKTFGQYLLDSCLDSLIVGVLCFIACLIFGVPYAMLVAVINGITNIIPFFGPFLGAIPSAILIFIADPPKALVFLIIILVIQQLDGNVIKTIIFSESTGLSALGVLVSITVMGGYFGLLGMFIGVPVAALICGGVKTLCEHLIVAQGGDPNLDHYYPPKTEKIDMQEHPAHNPFILSVINAIHKKLHPGATGVFIESHGRRRRKHKEDETSFDDLTLNGENPEEVTVTVVDENADGGEKDTEAANLPAKTDAPETEKHSDGQAPLN